MSILSKHKLKGRMQKIDKILKRLFEGLIPKSNRGKILSWMINDELSEEKNESLFRLWNDMDTTGISDDDIEDSLSKVKQKMGIVPSSHRRSRLLHSFVKYAAIFLLPLLTGVMVWKLMIPREEGDLQMVECFVPLGEQKQLTLSDGTSVTLNAGTLMVYPEDFVGKERKVYLSGEAYFDVIHNEDQPFIVNTHQLKVKVLGTRFNVESYSDNPNTTTTLKQGKVKVFLENEDEENAIIMSPDEQVVYNSNERTFLLKKVNATHYTDWTVGKIHIIQQPLSSVLKTLERNFKLTFIYDDCLKLSELYTVSFNKKESIEQVVHILETIIGPAFQTKVKGHTVYLYETKKGGQSN